MIVASYKLKVVDLNSLKVQFKSLVKVILFAEVSTSTNCFFLIV